MERTLLQQNGVVNPVLKTMPLLPAVAKTPIASVNAIVMNCLSAKECAAFSNASVFGVHTENGSFSKLTVFKFMHFH